MSVNSQHAHLSRYPDPVVWLVGQCQVGVVFDDARDSTDHQHFHLLDDGQFFNVEEYEKVQSVY